MPFVMAFGAIIMPVSGQVAFEIQELNTALEAAAVKIQALEAQLASSQTRNEALAQSAASANQEAIEVKEAHDRLRGLLEGLGIASLENGQTQIQERLLTALSDLRVSETSRRELATALMDLAEASVEFAREVKDTELTSGPRLAGALSKAEQALLASTTSSDSETINNIQDARVVSLKSELGLAILSVGHKDGVRSGMPFEIYREDKPIAKILITEVRNTVCGAVIQELANKADPVKVGDQGKVDINRSF